VRLVRGGLWIVVIGVPALAFYMLSYASWLPLCTVSTVSVSGNDKVSAYAIESVARDAAVEPRWYTFSPSFVVWYPRKSIESALLDRFPILESVSVRTPLCKQAARITVVERAEDTLWCGNNGECYFVDPHGLVFEKAPFEKESEQAQQYVRLSGGDIKINESILRQKVSEQHYGTLRNAIQEFALLGVPLTQCLILDADAYCRVSSTGWELRFALDKPLDPVLHNVKVLFENRPEFLTDTSLEYLDLRFDNKVYFRHKHDTVTP